MSGRPTRFCAKCGEYVVERYVTVGRGAEMRTELKLIHIDANGTQIYRAHAAVEEVYS